MSWRVVYTLLGICRVERYGSGEMAALVFGPELRLLHPVTVQRERILPSLADFQDCQATSGLIFSKCMIPPRAEADLAKMAPTIPAHTLPAVMAKESIAYGC